MDPSLIPDAKPHSQDFEEPQPVQVVSTKRLLSVEIGLLMPLISTGEAPLDGEDGTYLSAALANVSLAKDHQRKDEYAQALRAMTKAIRGINDLVALRKEKYPAYTVLEAPFYFAQGNLLGSYVEAKADVFGNVPQLDIGETSSEEDESEEGEPEDAEAKPEDAGAVVPDEQPKQAEDEPRIEDEAADTKEEEKVPQQATEEQGDGSSAMVEDVVENLAAAIQLTEDFVTSTPAASTVLSDLLIDSYIRYADITLFREQIPESIELYRKAVDLCKEQREGNERILSSTLYTIGCCYQQVNDNSGAAQAFKESLDILRAFIHHI